MSKIAEQVVNGLVDIQAISINIKEPFIWASGMKAPVYCDNRKSIGHYALRALIAGGLSALIQEKFPQVELIGGTATAGIPHATSVADKLMLPMVYFRSTAKDHGKQRMIEGDFVSGAKIVIVEDLISTGGSVLQCVAHAQAHGLDVLGVVSIFNYELQEAVDNFAAVNIPIYSLAHFHELYQVLNLLPEERDFVDAWRQNPQNTQLWKQFKDK